MHDKMKLWMKANDEMHDKYYCLKRSGDWALFKLEHTDEKQKNINNYNYHNVNYHVWNTETGEWIVVGDYRAATLLFRNRVKENENG